MKCPNCGKEIANDSQFCEHCGTKITSALEDIDSKNSKSSSHKWTYILFVIAIVLLGCFSVYEYSMHDQTLDSLNHALDSLKMVQEKVDLGNIAIDSLQSIISQTDDKILLISDDNFEDFISMSSHHLVIIDYYGKWCKPCRRLDPVLYGIVKDYHDKVTVGRYIVDDFKEIYVKKYNVTGIPTLIFLVDGVEKKRIVGYGDGDGYKIVGTIDKLLREEYMLQEEKRNKEEAKQRMDEDVHKLQISKSEDYFTETAWGMNMKMIWVEGGEFMMGCTSEQGGDCADDEKNVRRVTVDGFYIGMLEVTQAQWERVMGTSISQQRDKRDSSLSLYGVGPDYPMYYVSWAEAMEFCRLLSQKTGKTYTLPTEAQWEYAARGGGKNADGTKYAGSNMVDAVAWYTDNSGSKTHPCGTKRANALGIYDMSGNVCEWCKDWYSDSYTSYDTNNPTSPSSGSFRVYRGGSWSNYAGNCRVSFRNYGTPSYRSSNLGLRVVLLP